MIERDVKAEAKLIGRALGYSRHLLTDGAIIIGTVFRPPAGPHASLVVKLDSPEWDALLKLAQRALETGERARKMRGGGNGRG